MKTIKINIFLLAIFCAMAGYGQTTDSLSLVTEQSDIQHVVSKDFERDMQRKILQHLTYNYKVPAEAFEQEADNINYIVRFVLNEYGRIADPKITYKSASCAACEKELLLVLRKMSAIELENGEENATKVYYELPFRINIQ